jgi:ABC-type uncharacterized transport system permease subunit
MEKKTENQCHKLFLSELVTAIVCGYILYSLLDSTGAGADIRLILPGALLIFVLLQGAGYWYYRRQAVRGDIMDKERARILDIFAALKRLTPYVLCLFPLMILYFLVFDRASLPNMYNLFGLILWICSGIEFVNNYYFSVRFGNFKTKSASDLAMELAQKAQDCGGKS